MRKTVFIAAAVFFFGTLCYVASSRKDFETLGDNYYYLSPYEAMDVGYPGGSIVYKSSQKYSFESIKIKGQVIGVDYDEKFIVALQQKIDQADSKARFNYFIIEKKTDEVIGPFDKQAYLKARERLGISQELEIQKR